MSYPKQWRKRTDLGRVVYDRPKNNFRIMDDLRICISIVNNMSDSDKDKEIYAINTLWTVVSYGLYPRWLRAAHPDLAAISDAWRFWYRGHNMFEQAWKDMTIEVIRAIADRFGYPDWFTTLMLDLFFTSIWDAVDRIVGSFLPIPGRDKEAISWQHVKELLTTMSTEPMSLLLNQQRIHSLFPK